MDWNRIVQGDCIEGLTQIQAATIDLVFADPPFNIGYEYDVYKDRRDVQKYLDWSRSWGRAVERVLKRTGTFWLAIGDEYAAELKLIFQNELGFECRSWVIWYYTFGVNCTKKFNRSHTHLFHFVKHAQDFTFDSAAIRVRSARQLVYADRRANALGRLPDNTWILRPQDLPNGFQPDEDTWYFSRVCGTFKERAGWHGCQMPEQLLGRIIRASSRPGEIVLDPFAGSGTTLVVAKKLGRRWLGFELSSNYVTRISCRLDAAVEGQPLEGADDPHVSAPPTPTQNSAKTIAAAVAATSLRNESAQIRRGILEAFFAVRNGFSADRVVADPDLNLQFLEACRRLGLPGEPANWNFQLFNLRKASGLAGLPRSRSSRFSRMEIDECSYACESALQHLLHKGQSLDQVLCDPAEASAFDQLVQSMISVKISPFKTRWVALYIRKRAKENRQAGRELSQCTALPRTTKTIASLDCDAIPPTSGLYWLRTRDKKLYVGETLNLRRRFKLQFENTQFDFWGTDRRDLELRFRELCDVNKSLLRGNQSRWIAQWKPIGNYASFATV